MTSHLGLGRYRKTHNDGVFDAYTEEMKLARKSGILTGLPDGYGRGRIIGDYRRVPLYGIDTLVAAKERDLKETLLGTMTEEKIRLREEVTEQIKALKELKEMGNMYGFDLGKPASNAREAVQWLYFAYLGAVKEQVRPPPACRHSVPTGLSERCPHVIASPSPPCPSCPLGRLPLVLGCTGTSR